MLPFFSPECESSLPVVFLCGFNKATQLGKKKNNPADALFICDTLLNMYKMV